MRGWVSFKTESLSPGYLASAMPDKYSTHSTAPSTGRDWILIEAAVFDTFPGTDHNPIRLHDSAAHPLFLLILDFSNLMM